jgi:geranylgeranyl reductase family protein
VIYDVAVIGAGPVGSMATEHLAKAGLRSILVEEHSHIGEPCHCTGKLTSHAFEEFDLPKDVILNTINGYVIHSPGDVMVRICPKRAKSRIMDRTMFDQKLALRAEDAGAEIQSNTRAQDGTYTSNGTVRIITKNNGSKRAIEARMVIDAEGAFPLLLEKFGLRRKNTFIYGLQYYYSGASIEEPDIAHIFFGKNLAPGFIAWIAPSSETTAKVGLELDNSLSRRSPREYLERFVREDSTTKKVLRNAKLERVTYGMEPIGGAIPKSYANRFLVAGDAAGQVKSTSGGGIYYGLKAAKWAAETTINYLNDPDQKDSVLRQYEDGWKSALDKELELTAHARRVLNVISDHDLDTIFQMVSVESRMGGTLDSATDSAYQSGLAYALRQSLLRQSLANAKNLAVVLRGMMKWLATA